MFEKILIGHLIGDYLLQNKWMAMNKSGCTTKCAVHCLLYTISICIATWCASPLWIAIVFCSHFIVDRFSLADKWLNLINGRSLVDFIDNGMKDIPFVRHTADSKYWNYHSLRGGFTSLVYAVTDNTMHLVLMLVGYRMVIQ